eukprot:g4353.t1
MLRAVEEINGEFFEQSQAQSTIAAGPEPAPAGQQISRLRIEVDYIFLETQDIHHSQYWAMNNLTAQRSWPNRLNPTQRFLERNSFSLRYCEVNKEGNREVNCLFARAGLPTICVTGRPQPQKPFSRPYVRFQEPWSCEDNKNEQQEVEQRLFCDACKMDRHLALLHTVPFAAPALVETTTAGAGGGAASSNDTSRLALWQSRPATDWKECRNGRGDELLQGKGENKSRRAQRWASGSKHSGEIREEERRGFASGLGRTRRATRSACSASSFVLDWGAILSRYQAEAQGQGLTFDRKGKGLQQGPTFAGGAQGSHFLAAMEAAGEGRERRRRPRARRSRASRSPRAGRV